MSNICAFVVSNSRPICRLDPLTLRDYAQTVFDNFSVNAMVDRSTINFGLWDIQLCLLPLFSALVSQFCIPGHRKKSNLKKVQLCTCGGSLSPLTRRSGRARVPVGAHPLVQGRGVQPPVETMALLLCHGSGRYQECCGVGGGADASLSLHSGDVQGGLPWMLWRISCGTAAGGCRQRQKVLRRRAGCGGGEGRVVVGCCFVQPFFYCGRCLAWVGVVWLDSIVGVVRSIKHGEPVGRWIL
nr:uncharacterized protein LOC127321057 isoform X2 [Lolium perenne]